MLSFIDIRTLSSVSSIISLVLCICMLYVSQTRKTHGGFTQWTIASVLYCFALAFLGLRNILPDFVSIVVQNTLIVAGCAFIAYGIELFAEITKRIGIFVILILAAFALSLLFTYILPNVNARILVISVITAVIYGYAAFITHTSIPRLIHEKNTLLVLVFCIQSIWSIARIVQTVFIEKPVADFLVLPD